MKKVLLIAYYYYQLESPASPRTHGLYTYLPEFGWEVTILTVSSYFADEKMNIITANDKKNILLRNRENLMLNCENASASLNIQHLENVKLKKNRFSEHIYNVCQHIIKSHTLMNILRKINYKLSYPDFNIGWLKPAITAGTKELKMHHYDALISTQCPFTAHLIAKKLKEQTGLPWIADYRDLWSQWEISTPWKSEKQRNYDYKFEKSVISSADYVTVVSEPWAKELLSQHQKPTAVIPNGFDPTILNNGVLLSPKFTLIHAGVIYGRNRSPIMLFKAVRELIDEDVIDINTLSIDFYGPNEPELAIDISQYNLEKCISFHGIVSRKEITPLQRESQILLLLTADDPIDVGCYPAKLFEYLAAQRPILSFGYNGPCVISSLLKETHAGYHFCSYNELKEQIRLWYSEYKEKGSVPYTGDIDTIMSYSQKGMAEKFAKVLDEITCADNAINSKNYAK